MPNVGNTPQRAPARTRRFLTVALGVALLSACGVANHADAHEPDDRVEVRWFVGLGTGSQPTQIDAQEAVVAAFNASQDEIELVLEIVDNEVAYDVLHEQIANGTAPDIVGPMGIKGRETFAGEWLDLGPLASSVDTPQPEFESALLAQLGGTDSLEAFPYAVYPSFIFYNRDLFDRAGLPYPPARPGDLYQGREWTPDVVREVALALTLDKSGATATSANFDESNVVQWGFHHQHIGDPRAHGTFFGSGSVEAGDGTATIPQHWLDEWRWYYDLIWRDHAAPSQAQADSRMLQQGNAFNTGRIAMAFSHLWYTGTLDGGAASAAPRWDLAVPPTVNGVTTSKVHLDSFGILGSSDHPTESYRALRYLTGPSAKSLLTTYGSFPADPQFRNEFIDRLSATHGADIDWSLIEASLEWGDVPSHEIAMPNNDAAQARIAEFESLFESPGVDIGAEAARLRDDLSALFVAAGERKTDGQTTGGQTTGERATG